ncbi:hypothetical protein [Secundilactobacillus kimchicus]|uniref:hypothetical protein n=1 Tax=Secundilactobacillus kimchicus TaxID=528209 RepID=UPI000704FECC|nr:hypothetical protein [Secundilactobacillus kimchicus]
MTKMNNFDWRYAIFRNIELSIVLVSMSVLFFYWDFDQLTLTILLIEFALWGASTLWLKRPFMKNHPSYDPSNRSVIHPRIAITVTVLASLVIIGYVFFFHFDDNYDIPVWVIIINSFVHDGLTVCSKSAYRTPRV